MRVFAGQKQFVVLVGIAVLLAAGLLVAGKRAVLHAPVDEPVPADCGDICGQAVFDRDSYHLGDVARLRVRLYWQPAAVVPDLDGLVARRGFPPFRHRASRLRATGAGSAVVEQELLVVGEEPGRQAQLEAVTVAYRATGDNARRVLALPLPALHVAGFYPADVSKVGLQPALPAVDEQRGLRRALAVLAAILLFAAAALQLRRIAGRRPVAKLSRAEQLYRELLLLRDDGRAPANLRDDAVRLLARAVSLDENVSLREFWQRPACLTDSQRRHLDEVHDLLDGIYARGTTDEARVMRMLAATEHLLLPLVNAERLRREHEARLVTRLRLAPRGTATALLAVLAALVMLAPAVLPSLTLHPDVRAYNRLATTAIDADAATLAAGYLDLAARARLEMVRASASYNAGSLLAAAHPGFLGREQLADLKAALFRGRVTLDLLLHEAELDAEFELVTLLGSYARNLADASRALEAALVATPGHADAARNLEIVMKTRHALARSLDELLATAEAGTTDGQLRSQAVIDLRVLMETALPDPRAAPDAGKDDSEYYIMERF